MNIKDIKKAKKEFNFPFEIPKDKLEAIFKGQEYLMGKYKDIEEDHFKKIFGEKAKFPKKVWNGQESNLHTKMGNFLIKEMIDCCIHELSEAVQSMKNWKSWKQTEMETDVPHFKEELIDALHFFVEACIRAGITPDEIYEIYFKKNKVNQFRQDSNY